MEDYFHLRKKFREVFLKCVEVRRMRSSLALSLPAKFLFLVTLYHLESELKPGLLDWCLLQNRTGREALRAVC